MTSIAPVMKEEKFYKPLEAYLIEVNNECIAMEGPDTKRSVEVTLKVLEELIKKMKEANSMFAWMFNRLTYVGSYFDGLRVKEATEFDINVVLKLPLLYEKIAVKRDPKYPGFVKINVKNAKYPEDKLKRHERETEEIFKWWANADGDLSHLKVLRWWESIFSKLNGLSTLTVDNRDFKITNFKKAGPAMTARISDDTGYGIDVDLVPVIEFPDNIKPPQPIRQEPGAWYIVPKRIDTNEYVWRLSFPPQERVLMNGKNKLKMVNRFLKRIRDVLNWKPVSSYYIKTIFLWEASIQKDPTFFNKNLGFMLLYFLGKWTGYLEQKKLPFFWDKDMNLFEKINHITMDNYASRIKKLKASIEKSILDGKNAELNDLLKTLFKPNGNIITVAKSRSKPTLSDSEDSNLSLALLIDLDSSEEQSSDSLGDLIAPMEPALASAPPPANGTELLDMALDLVKSSVTQESSVDQVASSIYQVASPVHSVTSSVNQVTSPVHTVTSSVNQVTSPVHAVTSSVIQVTSPVHTVTSSANHVSSPGCHVTSADGCSCTSPVAPPDSSSSDDSQPIQNDFAAAKEKSLLEIEECKLRLRIAELDLETAKYNLKTAEKRFEMINLQFNALSCKSSD